MLPAKPITSRAIPAMKAEVSAVRMVERSVGPPVVVTGTDSPGRMRQQWNYARRRPAGPRQLHSRRTSAALPPHGSARAVPASVFACGVPTRSRHIAARLSEMCCRSAANHPPTILRPRSVIQRRARRCAGCPLLVLLRPVRVLGLLKTA
jgi:hypothetical protein